MQTHDTLFTPTEAAVLTGLPLKAVNNAIDRKTVSAAPDKEGGRLLRVARLHSGDPSIYGAIAEQMRRLDALGIPFDVTPGVPAFAAAAAALGCELTLPEIAQTVILTRIAVRSTAMPEGEALEHLAATGATLAIHLSIANLAGIVQTLIPPYGTDCPAVVAHRVSWPDELLIRSTLADICDKVKAVRITRTALILVGPALRRTGPDSRLYRPDHYHLFRPRRR